MNKHNDAEYHIAAEYPALSEKTTDMNPELQKPQDEKTTLYRMNELPQNNENNSRSASHLKQMMKYLTAAAASVLIVFPLTGTGLFGKAFVPMTSASTTAPTASNPSGSSPGTAQNSAPSAPGSDTSKPQQPGEQSQEESSAPAEPQWREVAFWGMTTIEGGGDHATLYHDVNTYLLSSAYDLQLWEDMEAFANTDEMNLNTTYRAQAHRARTFQWLEEQGVDLSRVYSVVEISNVIEHEQVGMTQWTEADRLNKFYILKEGDTPPEGAVLYDTEQDKYSKVSKTEYNNGDGTLKMVITEYYGFNDQLDKIEYLDGNRKLQYIESYEYNSDGSLKNITYTDADGNPVDKSVLPEKPDYSDYS